MFLSRSRSYRVYYNPHLLASLGSIISPTNLLTSVPKQTRMESEPYYLTRHTAQRYHDQSYEDYTNGILTAVFNISFHTTSPGIVLVDLKNVLLHQGLPLKLTLDRLDDAVKEAGKITAYANGSVFEYLLQCWKRLMLEIQNRAPLLPTTHKHMLKTSKRICFDNCILALTEPASFK